MEFEDQVLFRSDTQPGCRHRYHQQSKLRHGLSASTCECTPPFMKLLHRPKLKRQKTLYLGKVVEPGKDSYYYRYGRNSLLYQILSRMDVNEC